MRSFIVIKISWRDFLYNGKKVVVKNRILFIGSDILGKAHKRLYSPRLDIAFAPLNLNPDTVSIASELYKCIERKCREINMFVDKLKESCRSNALNYKRDLMEFRKFLYMWLINRHPGSLDPVEVIGEVDYILENPRSFIALEVCFTGFMKHTLGSLVNASILGYYGVIITNTSMLKKILRLKYYILSVPLLKNEKL